MSSLTDRIKARQAAILCACKCKCVKPSGVYGQPCYDCRTGQHTWYARAKDLTGAAY